MNNVKLAGSGSRMRGALFVLGLLFCLAVSQTRAVVLENGIDPANIGKGDWIYVLSTATSQHGGLDGLMAYEKSQGMNYLIVKAGDGSDLYPPSSPQFTSNVVDSAHAAGLKIFGYTRSFGTNIPGELAIITNAISLGADGYVIDAEQEWESQILPNNNTAALQLLQPIKAAFPNRFLGHAPQMYIHFHSSFPYTMFGIYCDAAMPQAYWKSFGITPTQCITDLGTDWRNWQNSLTGTNRNAIKPIAPVAQGYTPGTDPVTAAEITEFCNAMKTAVNPATAGGYKPLNYFRSELHSAEIWDAMRTNSIGDPQPVAPFVYHVQATNIAETSATIAWVTDTDADSILDYGHGAGFSNSITNSTLVTSHSIVISGLTQTNSYHFRVRSKAGGSTNVTYSGDFTFTTRIAGFVPDIIVDNTNAVVVGSWTTGTSSADRYGADYRFRGVGTGANFLVYNPTITQAGLYQIFETHPQGSNRSTNAPYVITYYGGVQTNYVNQQVGGGLVGGTFNSLATVYFQAGTNGSVKITDAFTSTNGLQVIADALKFVYVGQPTPPNITAQPQGQTVNPGSTVTFAVIASGLAPLTYQWQFNGGDIPGATSASYLLANAQVADAGIYTVVVSNPGGDTESANAVLNVNAAPSISAQPASQTVNPGDPTSFTVTATGYPAPTFQWWFAGAPIAAATDSTYVLASVQPNQAGNYWAVVSNSSGSVTSSIVSLSVNIPVAITTQPISQSVMIGNVATFSVTATGSPAPTFQWWFAGAPIATATDSFYALAGVQPNEAGNYWVVVSNSSGSVTSSIVSLSVNIPAAIATQPISQSVTIGSNATFSVTATGTPAPTFQWWFAGAPIATATDSYYALLHVQPNQAGNYWAVVSNSSGSVTSSIVSLSVNIPAAITTQPISQSVTIGSNATFSVTATGTPAPTYQWWFAGAPIATATDSSYALASVQPDQAGEYLVVVSNSSGSVTSSIVSLAVNIPAAITTQPISQSVTMGGNATFSVTATGSPAPTYQWWFAGAPIATATDSTNVLANVQPNQAGDYWVVVSNSSGSVTSSIVSLSVNIPPSITTQPISQSVTMGSNATFSVTAIGTPAPTFQWWFAGTPIVGATQSTYTRVSVQTNQLGNYWVVVSNTSGSVTSSIVSLSVNVAPRITTQPVSQTVIVGSNATFSVTATGSPAPAFQWWFAGAPIAAATQSTYTRANVQTNQAGNYWVVVGNTSGSVTSSIVSLSVNIPPSITSQPISQSVTPGHNATFSVVATGTPAPTFQWWFAGTPISGATRSAYTRYNVQTSQVGNYWVVVSNPIGSVTSSIVSLSLNIAPHITTQPKNQTTTVGNNATFSVTATGSPAPTYQWWFAGTPIAAATQSTYALANVQTSQAGKYWVVVSNSSGSVTSYIVSLSVKNPPNTPPSITTQPINQSVTIGSNATLSVTATGSPAPTYQWWFAGTPIAAATNSSYAQASVQTNQAGSYWVVVSNSSGSMTSSIVSLSVNIPPTITTQPISQSVTIGSNATFSVTATGTAPSKYQWSFNGSPILDATGSSYTVLSAQTNNAGSYSVVITNVAGSITSSNAQLTIKALQPAQFQLISVLPDGRAHLIITGQPGASYAIEGSSNLVDWLELMTVVNTNGTIDVIYNSASNGTLHFYRARQ
ncbi:immunoglobulin domain-containing protein [Pedosphaera parvula]|nr:immunoglobulin domain-containing protein [Pedosphaera parvula]